MKKGFLSGIFFFAGMYLGAQTYSPIAVTGYNQDVIAETTPSSLATTSMSMDLSNHVMYSVGFAVSAGLPGGIVNSGTIVSGLRTYQLNAFNGNNSLYLGSASTQNLTVSSPASYSKISLMAFSTEGSGTISITLGFTDGSTVTTGSYSLADWFYGPGAVYCCFGRISRVATAPYNMDGYPSDPRFYPVDITIPCAYRVKSLQTITIAHTTGTYAFIMALSGVPYAMTVNPTITNVSCAGGTNGHASLSVSGTNGPFSYSWNTVPPQNSATASNLPAGNYICNITDANGCVTSQSITVTQPPALTVVSTQTNPDCNGSNNGFASVTISGGTPNYTYAWSPSGGNGPGANNLAAGNYSCLITDANGCTMTRTFNLTQPAAVTATSTQSNVSCNGGTNGSAIITASGGNPGYTYLWSPSGGTGATENNLAAGNYTCTITDINGCTGSQAVSITEPSVLSAVSSGTNVSCYNACDGQMSVLPSGGVASYTYSWNSGCTSASCANVCPGNYSVTVTDANGCSTTSSVSITQPTAISIVTSATDAHCNQSDGSATGTASGGTGTYSYTWLPGNFSGNVLSATAAGNYSVVVTDANACTDTASVTVANLNGVTASLSSTSDVSCFGGSNGSASITQSGGNPAYTYSWTPSSAGNSANAGNLPAGNYSVMVTDANGCMSTVTLTITEPPQLNITTSAVPAVVCAGTAVQLNATPSGGTPAYAVVWNPGNLAGNSQNIIPSTSTTYSATVTDQNGCTATDSVLITVNPLPVPGLLGDELSACVPACIPFNDISTAGPNGSIVSWNWDFGDGNTSTQQNPLHCYATAGVYSIMLTVSSAAGCSNTVTFNNYITAFPDAVAVFSASPQPASIIDPFVTFTDSSTNAATWFWNFGDPAGSFSSQQNPGFAFPDATCYDVALSVSSPDGCLSSVTHRICVEQDVSLYVPNAFTPDGNGQNDVFLPVGNGIDPAQYHFTVYDRWGNLVFETSDLSKGWDGRKQGHSEISEEDVYVWKIEAIDLLGKNYDLIGHVSLLH